MERQHQIQINQMGQQHQVEQYHQMEQQHQIPIIQMGQQHQIQAGEKNRIQMEQHHQIYPQPLDVTLHIQNRA
eukprot:12965577-Ditylum_brightwellii.AAC.1